MPSEKENKKFMDEALNIAEKALENGEIPVGAVVVENGKVIGRGHNRQSTDSDPTAHAEMVALREGGRYKKNFRLDGAVMYSTVKPCPMCRAAIKRARIEKVYYSAEAARESTHSTEFIETDIAGSSSAEVMQEFFKQRR